LYYYNFLLLFWFFLTSFVPHLRSCNFLVRKYKCMLRGFRMWNYVLCIYRLIFSLYNHSTLYLNVVYRIQHTCTCTCTWCNLYTNNLMKQKKMQVPTECWGETSYSRKIYALCRIIHILVPLDFILVYTSSCRLLLCVGLWYNFVQQRNKFYFTIFSVYKYK
jgi:hypothetical protein